MLDTKYIVVGGVFTDTTFSEFKDGSNGEKYGPYNSYTDALIMWNAKSWSDVDNCHSRYTIKPVGENHG